MPVFGERKNSSKSGVVWEREGRNQGSKFSRVLGSYSWGLIPGLIDCNELLVSEKNSREKHPLCPVSSSSQVLQALKFCLRGRQRSLSVSSKLSSPGENFFPTTTKGTRERISCAKSKGLLRGFQLLLILKAGRKRVDFSCLPWLAVPGSQSISLVGQDGFSRVKEFTK